MYVLKVLEDSYNVGILAQSENIFFHFRHPAMVSLQQAKSLVQNLIQTVSSSFVMVDWLLRNM